MVSNIESKEKKNSRQHLTESYFINYNDHNNNKMMVRQEEGEEKKKRTTTQTQSNTLSWFNEKTTHTHKRTHDMADRIDGDNEMYNGEK